MGAYVSSAEVEAAFKSKGIDIPVTIDSSLVHPCFSDDQKLKRRGRRRRGRRWLNYPF
jgi:hypothetical protein